MDRRSEIDDTITLHYNRFSAMETQLLVRLLPPSDATDPVSHFLTSVNDHSRHGLQNISDSDMVGITIQNRVNQNNKPIGISFRRKGAVGGRRYMDPC